MHGLSPHHPKDAEHAAPPDGTLRHHAAAVGGGARDGDGDSGVGGEDEEEGNQVVPGDVEPHPDLRVEEVPEGRREESSVKEEEREKTAVKTEINEGRAKQDKR